LIDSRLDTIDRMLLGRLSRQDRLAIVREVESQIHELIQANDADELTREDVLAVLARLDPPEAYLPDETDGGPVSVQRSVAPRVTEPLIKGDRRVARISGILGLSALALILLMPLVYFVAIAFNSEVVLFALGGGILMLISVAATLGLVLGIVARQSGVWALVGIVTSVLAPLLVLVILTVVFMLV
jgi:hypothetical protein